MLLWNDEDVGVDRDALGRSKDDSSHVDRDDAQSDGFYDDQTRPREIEKDWRPRKNQRRRKNREL